MKKYFLFCCAVLMGGALMPYPGAAATSDPARWNVVFTTLPVRGLPPAPFRSRQPLQPTIPYYTAGLTSPFDHDRYTFHIAGTNPRARKVSTALEVVPIVMRIHFPNGAVLDPTMPGCNDTVSVAQRFFGSPLFASTTEVSNGVDVGDTQLLDAFQRAQSWAYTAGSNYHVLLRRAAPERLVDVDAPAGSETSRGACTGSGHDLGQIDINAFDAIVRKLIDRYATTTQLPVPLAYNIVETEGGCCILGYHSAYKRDGGTQVYGVATYADPGIFSGIQDIGPFTTELGNLFDDPFVDNATPPWSAGNHSCQRGLEVGGTGLAEFSLSYGGFTYHPAELAFIDWFFRTPSHGPGNPRKYSYQGTYTGPANGC